MRRFAREVRAGRCPVWIRLAALCLPIVCFSGNVRAADQCAIKRIIETPMLPDEGYSPLISAMLNDKPSKIMLDTGGFWSMISPEGATGLAERLSPVQARLASWACR